ncbi:MAG: Maf family protein [Minwuia sp.]|nr:Maf family protein [Minwuia sp.]
MTSARPTGLVLASGSMTRRRLLDGAGLEFQVMPADVDEGAIKAVAQREGQSPDLIALALAREKANVISDLHPEELVLAADQILVAGDSLLDKPVGREGLKSHIAQLSGRVHFLINGVILMRAGSVIWSYSDRCEMEMRPLSADEQALYVSGAPDAVMSSVGGYRIEAEGIHLFQRMTGDWSSILGLPLLPVLAALRQAGIEWCGEGRETE